MLLPYSGAIPTIEDLKKVDNALWSFGKWFKSQNKMENVPLKREADNHHTYIPNDDFKRKVIKKIEDGQSHLEAIESVASDFGVTLAPSYYKYPGSHIHRWKKTIKIKQ